ncbi:acyltransferase family protein [Streptomyces sp. NPDC004435]|uniref:acyltransferase family protein n=1 Tax=Streptomyces sp. NPDC004435 TaxID=3364701 RepID=UPI0036C8A1EB
MRLDIQGLRAVAVGLVVLSHSGIGGLAGGYVGVDVFFVISGFLITSLMLREVEATGRIALGRFYARRALRLLPASTVVVLTTLAGAWLFLGPLRFVEYTKDAFASALYFVNLRLADVGTQYLNADAPPSPFQHFWSLAVEEQFYLVWPLVMLLAVRWLARRRLVLAVLLTALCAGSFLLNLDWIETSSSWAYFGSPARAWELGAGALLALAAGRLSRLPGPVAALLGWSGLAAISYAALAFDESTPFPGWYAVVPVFGAVAVLAAGMKDGGPRYGAGALLGLRPAVWIGGLSYSWYLWHWPLMVILPAELGDDRILVKLLAAVLALNLAWLTLKFVEDPVRFHRAFKGASWRGLSLGLALSAGSAAIALLAAQVPLKVATGPDAPELGRTLAAAEQPEGALAELLDVAPTRLPGNLRPRIDQITVTPNTPFLDGCHSSPDTVELKTPCEYGDRNGDRLVVLFGDSHVTQWFPAVDALAKEHNWRLVSLTKAHCKPGRVTTVHAGRGGPYEQCNEWRAKAVEYIDSLQPDVVLTSFAVQNPLADSKLDPRTEWTRGLVEGYQDLRRSGARVAALTDIPYLRQHALDCALAQPLDLPACERTTKNADAAPVVTQAVRDAARKTGVDVIETRPWLCSSNGRCPLVVGDTLVYRDRHHLSEGFALKVAPVLERVLTDRYGTELGLVG